MLKFSFKYKGPQVKSGPVVYILFLVKIVHGTQLIPFNMYVKERMSYNLFGAAVRSKDSPSPRRPYITVALSTS